MNAFEQAYRTDDNVWWSSESGDCQNAYDVALEELDSLRAAVTRLRTLCDETAARPIMIVNGVPCGSELSTLTVAQVRAVLGESFSGSAAGSHVL